MADEADVVALEYLYTVHTNETNKWCENKEKKQKGRFWIHEVISKRSELGEYHRLIQELHDPVRFRRYFRMSTSQFDMLLWLISSEIEKMDTNWSPSMSPTERLAITLRSVCTITWRNSSFWYLQRFHQTNANGDVLAGFDPLSIGLAWNAARPIQGPIVPKCCPARPGSAGSVGPATLQALSRLYHLHNRTDGTVYRGS